jgi:uncharacterized protein
MNLRLSRLYLIVLTLFFLATGCSTPLSQAETQSEIIQPTVTPTPENLGQVLPITARAIMGGKSINLEVANTPEEQALGLMYRRELADDRGMLFPFAEPTMARFWMKNCLISLDLVFLRGNQIKYITENAPPCQKEPCPTYGPSSFVDRVIELRGGRARELGLKKGDFIGLKFLDSPKK